MAEERRGLHLVEINRRYPQNLQPLGYDVLMDSDSMYKPKVIPTFELVVNSILTLLFMKPGQYPSVPELGIDIENYLHEYADDPAIPGTIKSKLEDQCNRIGITGVDVDIVFDRTSDGKDAMVVRITGNAALTYGLPSNQIIIGITYSKLNQLYVRKQYIK